MDETITAQDSTDKMMMTAIGWAIRCPDAFGVDIRPPQPVVLQNLTRFGTKAKILRPGSRGGKTDRRACEVFSLTRPRQFAARSAMERPFEPIPAARREGGFMRSFVLTHSMT